MGFKLAVLAIRFVVIMFFTGLVGCAVTVMLSWIYVGKDSFSKKD